MSKLIQLLKSFVLILSLTSIFLGCDDTENYYRPSNYFPLNSQAQWEYQWEYGCGCPEKFWPPSEPMILKVTGDTILHGKAYSKIENEYGVIKIIRQEGEQYFRVNLGDGTESLFLDTAMPVGRSLTLHNDEFWEHKLIPRKRNQTMIVNNVTYHNVLVVEEQLLYEDDHDAYTNSTFHYYANGIGEILTYNPPTPYSYIPFGSKYSLVRFK